MLNPWHITQAVRKLRAGGVIAYPTESVYGLGCLLFAQDAVARILCLKRRRWQKGLIVVAASYEQIRPLLNCDASIEKRLLDSWPGPYTWLVRAQPKIPYWLRGVHTDLAVRVSAHPVVCALCLQVGPIISTSANPSGYAPARTGGKVRYYFRTQLDYIIPGHTDPSAPPTEIRHAQTTAMIRNAV